MQEKKKITGEFTANFSSLRFLYTINCQSRLWLFLYELLYRLWLRYDLLRTEARRAKQQSCSKRTDDHLFASCTSSGKLQVYLTRLELVSFFRITVTTSHCRQRTCICSEKALSTLPLLTRGRSFIESGLNLFTANH